MGFVKKTRVGIDEVGRGPIAGPVAVCALAVPEETRTEALDILDGICDSKRMSPKKREEWVQILEGARRKKLISFVVSFVGPEQIDSIGIVSSLHRAVSTSLKKLGVSEFTTEVVLDGGLQAPGSYKNQKTIVRGEDAHVEIAAASVVAKVKRDMLMRAYDTKYPEYGFAQHKGYGTIAHYEALGKYGPTPIHRKSFLQT